MGSSVVRRAIVLGVATVAAVLPVSAAHSDGATGVAVVAHRGNSSAAPENTLSAVTQAIAERADYVEIDVRLTRDGVPVLLHDMSLARTTDVEAVFPDRSPWYVQQFTLAELQRLDAGAWKSETYAGERVPTLGSALAALAASPSGAFVEVKDPGAYGGIAGIGQAVQDTIDQKWPAALSGGDRDLVRVQSYDQDFVGQFTARFPTPVSVIGEASPEVVASSANDMQVYYGTLTQQLTSDAHLRGLTVGAYTVDNADAMKRLASETGVDSITTNLPARLRTTLAGEGLAYSGTPWPGRTVGMPRWSVTGSGRYLATRVRVTAALATADGSPAAWVWAAVQRWETGAWRHLMWRATDAAGRFSTTVAGTPSLRIRVVSRDDWQFPIAASAAKDIPLSKISTSVQLTGPYGVRAGRGASLAVRWKAPDGRAVSDTARLYRRPAGGSWRFVRQVGVRDGAVTTRVYPDRTTRYRVRGLAGWWHYGDIDDAVVRVTR